ncbi:MAG: hypothetical protein IJ779_04025 [Ruminococcus sp.]|nr:hypothetical protein [Ruminococcus sp.]
MERHIPTDIQKYGATLVMLLLKNACAAYSERSMHIVFAVLITQKIGYYSKYTE